MQRMLMKLTARRGQFLFMENFGSRLWTLDRLRPAERQAAAEQYVLEALRDESGLTVEQVTLAENGGKASMTVNAVTMVPMSPDTEPSRKKRAERFPEHQQ